MTISSRTPEGVPGQCPICEKLICVDPSQPTGDVSCPRCGTLLWFIVVEGASRFYPQGEISPRKKQLLECLAKSPMDYLDFVYLMYEWDCEFGLDWGGLADKMHEMHSVGDVIDYIIREMPD